jgi:hypothetical protein
LSKIVSNGVTVELHNEFVKFKTAEKACMLQKAKNESMWIITSTTMADHEATLMESTPTPITKKMEIMEAHEKLGHPDEKTNRLTLESFRWNAIGEMEPCDGCLKHKAKAKNVSHKPSKTQATKPGGRLLMDTTGPYVISAGGTKYDLHVVAHVA